jgi:hypothetical protein
MLPGRPNAALNEALLNTDLPLLLFEAEPDFFHDSCHLTARGYEELGRKFSQIILTNWNFLHIDPKQNP